MARAHGTSTWYEPCLPVRPSAIRQQTVSVVARGSLDELLEMRLDAVVVLRENLIVVVVLAQPVRDQRIRRSPRWVCRVLTVPVPAQTHGRSRCG